MNTHDYDLVVAYRIYPKVSGKPALYGHNKLQLSEFCLRSFKKSLGLLRTKMYVILDGCQQEYEELFRKYFDYSDLEFIKLNGVGNHATFSLQVKILTEQKESDIVYFAEDDYFYIADKFKEMIDFIKNNPTAHFVTPYDHLDYYTIDLHSNRVKIAFYGKRHWRTASSTCLTFLTTKEILLKTKHVLLSYERGNLDVSMWLSLTKYDVLNPFRILRYLLKCRVFAYYVLIAWRYCWIQIVFKREWNLWCPVPSIATHIDERFLAPTIGKTILTKEI